VHAAKLVGDAFTSGRVADDPLEGGDDVSTYVSDNVLYHSVD
jgi:hypothetical protein